MLTLILISITFALILLVMYKYMLNNIHYKWIRRFELNHSKYDRGINRKGCLRGCWRGKCPNGNDCFGNKCCKYDFQCKNCL